MSYVVVPLNFLLQYIVSTESHTHLVPKASYFLSLSKSIYDAESMQSLLYSMTLDSYEPYLTEKTDQSLQYYLRFNTSFRVLYLQSMSQFRHSLKKFFNLFKLFCIKLINKFIKFFFCALRSIPTLLIIIYYINTSL